MVVYPRDRGALRVAHQVDLRGAGDRAHVVDHPGELRTGRTDDRVETSPGRVARVRAEGRCDHTEPLPAQRLAQSRHGVGAVVERPVHQNHRPRVGRGRSAGDRGVHRGWRAGGADGSVDAVERLGHVGPELARGIQVPDEVRQCVLHRPGGGLWDECGRGGGGRDRRGEGYGQRASDEGAGKSGTQAAWGAGTEHGDSQRV